MNEIHVEPHTPDEIAVDLPFRERVIEYLIDLGAGLSATGPDDENKTLDLGLIRLSDVRSAANKVMTGEWGSRGPIDLKPELRDPEVPDIDKIIGGLRAAIGKDFAGWYPRMGKVRSADLVGGLPHTGAGWEYPKPATNTAFLRPATASAGWGVVIGVIDAPMYPSTALEGRWYPRPEPSPEWSASKPYPWLRGHSAFVAGRILDRAPGAKLAVRGVLETDTPVATVWTVATAMAAAVDEDKVDVLNLSLGCFTEDGQPPFVLARAVEVLSKRGVPLIAAAGNHGEGKTNRPRNAPIFPAACPGVVAVGAFKKDDQCSRASMSPDAPWIVLGAPGEQVESTYFDGEVAFSQLEWLPKMPPNTVFCGYATWSGTSFAAAAVSGEIARMMTGKGYSAAEALAKLLETKPCDNDGIGRYIC